MTSRIQRNIGRREWVTLWKEVDDLLDRAGDAK
jgi:hypothetical protein